MSKYNFDKVIDRRGTSSLKYDFAQKRIGREDLLPLWVADMDFALPEEILDVIKVRVDHGIFGYTDPDAAYYDTLENWFETRYGYQIKREWNTVTPGVVYALATAIRAFTEAGESVLIQEPVYYPFREMIESNYRKCVNNQLVLRDGHYEVDFEAFEKTIIEENVRLFLLCSPHNPAGRVWTREELVKMADICLKHEVKIICDEIHCDFIFPGQTFIPFATLGDKYLNNVVICTSASKSFNIAGFQVANILVPDEELRKRFKEFNAAAGYSQGNALGLVATKAVYDLGGQWLDELVAYLNDNLAYVRNFLKERLPQIELIEPEGTYLIWLDCKGVVKDYPELKRLIYDEAKLWLDDGAIFGEETLLFERINIACPRSILEQAMTQLEEAVKTHKA